MNIDKILIDETYIFTNESRALLIFAFLYHNEKINKDKLHAMLKGLREKTLLTYRKNYKDSTSKKWYNDMNMISILEDTIKNINISKTSMTVDEFIHYVRLLHNKPKNWCIDFIYFNYLAPLIERYGRDEEFHRVLKTLSLEKDDLYKINFITLDNSGTGSGYCCEDHDGPYNEYKERTLI